MQNIEKEPITKGSIAIKAVSEEEFQKLKDSTVGIIEVKQDDWVQTFGNVPILNDKASTCALIYVYCNGNREMLAGHFIPLEMHELPGLEEIKQMDNLERYIQLLSFSGVLDSFSRYKSMLYYRDDLIRRYGPNHVETYLFGQHFHEEPLRMGRTLIGRSVLNSDLTHQGIGTTAICDYRALEVYKTPGDDTLYVPNNKTIYLNRAG